MPLVRLTYCSLAVGSMPYATLMGIMTYAQERNPARGITGILCYGSGQFLQALEGERAAVNALYHAIALDPRHERCQLLSVDEITARDFPEWSMKVVNWEDAHMAQRRATLAADTGSEMFDPERMLAADATAFLRRLAELERALMDE